MTTCPPLPLSLSLPFRLLFRQISPGERNTSVSLTERIEERRRSQLAHVPNRDKVSLGARNARRSVSRQKWHFSCERGGGRNKTEKLFQGQGKESRKEEKRRRRRGLFTYETRAAAAVCRTLSGEG